MSMDLWMFMGIAVVAIAVALIWVLPSLLRTPKAHDSERRALNIAVYRDQLKDLEGERDSGALNAEQFEQAKIEIEDRLSEDALQAQTGTTSSDKGGRWVGWTVAGVLPALVIGIYVLRGVPDILITPALAAAPKAEGANPHGEGDMTTNMAANMAQIEAELDKIKQATDAAPKDGHAWFKLAMANLAMERFPVALDAFKKAAELLPKEAGIFSHYAEAVAMSSGRNLEGEPMRLVRKALELNPLEPKALEIAGIYAYQNSNWAQAAYYWKALLKQMNEADKQSPYAKSIAEAERDARGKAEAGMAAIGGKAEGAKAKPKVAAGPGVAGRVELAAELKTKVKPDDTLFLFARAGENGPPMAVMKAKVSALPLDFVLDDSMAMSPDMAISKVPEVVLTARISKSGQPKAVTGDLEGKLTGVKVGAKGVKLVIDRIQP
ncbi:MAG: c-type cytochrome biogenesis protein CcmI [Betaproteobacteria bacterium]|jgi:cytochrome c-type biogenesis protein CcmH|nr:MAG: c-type cytochrome biogenesis protein CcmI [Betaproteobacteria bacterium]